MGPRLGGTYVTDMRHCLNERGAIPDDLPGPALNLTVFLGAIVAWVSSGRAGGDTRTNVPCRRTPGRRRCPGEIVAAFDADGSTIQWECHGCGDNGVTRGWEGTPWDEVAVGRTGGPRPPSLSRTRSSRRASGPPDCRAGTRSTLCPSRRVTPCCCAFCRSAKCERLTGGRWRPETPGRSGPPDRKRPGTMDELLRSPPSFGSILVPTHPTPIYGDIPACEFGVTSKRINAIHVVGVREWRLVPALNQRVSRSDGPDDAQSSGTDRTPGTAAQRLSLPPPRR
jgi:hypothetical protein